MMVDLVRDRGIVLAEGIVGELGEVHDRLTALQVRFIDRRRSLLIVSARSEAPAVAVEPSVAIEPGIEAHDVEAAGYQNGDEAGSDIAFTAGYEDAHKR